MPDRVIADQAAARHARTIRILAKEAAREPALAIFWFVPRADGPELLEIATPFSECPLEAGLFRNQSVAHYTGWKVFQRTMPELRDIPYEAFPRGRVTFINEDGGTFNLMVDPLIMARPALMAKLFATFNLPVATTRTMLDSHYRSQRNLDKAI